MEREKPERLRQFEKMLKDGLAARLSAREFAEWNAYLSRLQFSFEKSLEQNAIKSAFFRIGPFKGKGKPLSFAKAPKGKTAAAAGKTFSPGRASAPRQPGQPAAPAATKTPQANNQQQRRQPAPPSIKVLILMKLIELVAYVIKKAFQIQDELSAVNKEVMAVQAGLVRTRK